MKYSTFDWPALHFLKKLIKEQKKKSDLPKTDIVYKLLHELEMSAFEKPVPGLNLDLFMGECGLLKALLVYEDKIVNYYLETKALYDFLRLTEIKDVQAMASVVSEDAVSTPTLAFNGHIDEGAPVMDEDARARLGMIHVPGIKTSFAFEIMASRKLIEGVAGVVIITNGDDVRLCPLSEKHYRGKAGDWSDSAQRDVQLVGNLFMYIACFPESLIDDPPEELLGVYKNQRNKKGVTLATHNSLISRDGVTPHFRRGHFRLLASERYTKKRGQVIFVRSSFVKGKSKTVLDKQDKSIMIRENV